MRAPDSIGAGTADVTIRIDPVAGVPIASTTHFVPIELVRKRPRNPEAITTRLIKTIPHPDRKGAMGILNFSPDGKQILSGGYPSGILQTWDAKTLEMLVRIDSPAGLRGTFLYAVVEPDWKHVLVPVKQRNIVKWEEAKKEKWRVEFSGEVRRWDLSSGKEQPAWKFPKGRGIEHLKLADDGKTLVGYEHHDYDSDQNKQRGSTVVFDLATRKQISQYDQVGQYVSSPNEREIAYEQTDYQNGRTTLLTLDLQTGRVKREKLLSFSPRQYWFSVLGYDSTGSKLIGAKSKQKGLDCEILCFDSATLEERILFSGKHHPAHQGWFRPCTLTPDKQSIVIGDQDKVRVLRLRDGVEIGAISPPRSTVVRQYVLSKSGDKIVVALEPYKADDPEVSEASLNTGDFPECQIHVYDVPSGKLVHQLTIPPTFVVSLAFSPDQRQLAVGGIGSFHLLDVSN